MINAFIRLIHNIFKKKKENEFKRTGSKLPVSIKSLINSTDSLPLFKMLPDIRCTPTGYIELDKVLYGWTVPELTIIASFYRSESTDFALKSILHGCLNYATPILYFSIDFSSKELINRIFSSLTSIELIKLKSEKFTKDEWELIKNSCQQLKNAPLFIHDNQNLTLNDIWRQSNLHKIKNEIRIIVVDKYPLIKGGHSLIEISDSLKKLAIKLNVSILLISITNEPKGAINEIFQSEGFFNSNINNAILINASRHNNKTTENCVLYSTNSKHDKNKTLLKVNLLF